MLVLLQSVFHNTYHSDIKQIVDHTAYLQALGYFVLELINETDKPSPTFYSNPTIE